MITMVTFNLEFKFNEMKNHLLSGYIAIVKKINQKKNWKAIHIHVNIHKHMCVFVKNRILYIIN